MQLSQPEFHCFFQIKGRKSVLFDKINDLQTHNTPKSLYRLYFKV